MKQWYCFWLLIFIIIGLFLSKASPAKVPSVLNHYDSKDYDFVTGEALVRLHDYISSSDLKALEQMTSRLGVQILNRFSIINAWYVKLPPNMTVQEAIQIYEQQPGVRYAEPNYLQRLHSQKVPTDIEYDKQWGLKKVNAPEAWNLIEGVERSEVVVAVIDTGVDWRHPDLLENIWVNQSEIAGNGVDDDNNGYIDDRRGWDFVDIDIASLQDKGWRFFNGEDYTHEDNDPSDLQGHGTHVAGIIGARTNNTFGIAGISWNRCRILPLRAAYKAQSPDGNVDGYFSMSSIVKAIEYAHHMGAKVINASFGGKNYNQLQFDAIKAITDQIVFVASAGNDNKNIDHEPLYPASFKLPNIISVAAADQNDKLASHFTIPFFNINILRFSNYGPTSVDVAAPGKGIYSTLPNKDFGYSSGTSMAAPFVAGLSGLIFTLNPKLTPKQIGSYIILNSDNVTGLLGKVSTGGRINAAKTVASVLLTIVAKPILTSSLHLLQAEPYVVGQTVTATFSITNKGGSPITFERLLVGGRLNNTIIRDFEVRKDVVLQPNATYTYQGKITFTEPGEYRFFPAYKPPGGEWEVDVPAEPGVTKLVTITVRERQLPIPSLEYRISSDRIQVNQSFEIFVRLRNTGGPGDHGGISISFPSLNAVDPTTPPYETEQARIEIHPDTNFERAEVNFFNKDSPISVGDKPGTAGHLLVEGDENGWSSNEEQVLKLTVTPKQAFGAFTIRIRGWICMGGPFGYGPPCQRDPATGGAAREQDQQQYWTYAKTITIERIDSIAPYITLRDPPPNATGISINTSIIVTFSKPMNTSTIQSAFSIIPPVTPKITGTFSWNAEKTVFTFKPDRPLEYGKLYTVTVSAAATDLVGNPLKLDGNSWSFTTESKCFFADINCDSEVDITDVQLVANRWNTRVGNPRYEAKYDVNNDGEIDIIDIQKVANWWGKKAPFPSTPAAPSLARSLEKEVSVYLRAPQTPLQVSEKLEIYIMSDHPIKTKGLELRLAYSNEHLRLIQVTSKSFAQTIKTPTSYVIPLGPEISEREGDLIWGKLLVGSISSLTPSETLAIIEMNTLIPGIASIQLKDIRLIDEEGHLLSASVPEPAVIKIRPRAPIISALGQNYPNPFNPETWIPYQLAIDSKVVIDIYNIKGERIRRLDLGYKEARYYLDRSSAAYWDGRNEQGEYVASGVYFYTLQTGSLVITKRMVVTK